MTLDLDDKIARASKSFGALRNSVLIPEQLFIMTDKEDGLLSCGAGCAVVSS